MLMLAAIGDIARFPSARQLVGYAGLGTRVHDSGKTHKHGRITKKGRRDLRHALIEAAWVAVEHNPAMKARFERLSQRMPRAKAIVAIARRLLARIWVLWSRQEVDRELTAPIVAKKMRSWAIDLRKTGRGNKTSGEFIRARLDDLCIGQLLTEVPSGNRNRFKLPPSRHT
jgi:hypothetical protein